MVICNDERERERMHVVVVVVMTKTMTAASPGGNYIYSKHGLPERPEPAMEGDPAARCE
jgi:hypothetical protein